MPTVRHISQGASSRGLVWLGLTIVFWCALAFLS